MTKKDVVEDIFDKLEAGLDNLAHSHGLEGYRLLRSWRDRTREQGGGSKAGVEGVIVEDAPALVNRVFDNSDSLKYMEAQGLHVSRRIFVY